MGGFLTTLDCLIQSQNRDAPAVFEHLLTRSDMVFRRRTVERLLAVTDGRRQAMLIQHYALLGHDLENLLVEQIGRLGPAMRHAMASRQADLQRRVLDLIDRAADPSLVYLAAEAVNSPHCEVRAHAVDILWRWTADLRRRETDDSPPLPHEAPAIEVRRLRQFILDGLRKAFASPTAPETPRVLRAVAMIADESAPWFWSALAVRRDARRRALFQLLTDRLEPELFGFVVRALERESTGSDAAELLQRPFSPAELDALLREVGRQPRLSQQAVGRLREVPWLTPGDGTLERLPAESVAFALALAVRAGVLPAQLAMLCRSVATGHADARARRIALDALAHCGDAALTQLCLVAEEAEGPVATLAAVHLARRGELGAASPRLIGAVLRDWSSLREPDRRDIARAIAPALRDDPDLLRRHLAVDSPRRIAALTLVRMAALADVFSPELVALASDESDRKLQSAALAAVARSTAANVADVLRRGLASPDPRVRANAVEALDRRDAQADIFLPFVTDSNNRVRANAALALIERDRPEGRDALRAMFKAGQADRLSALWVFSKARPRGFVSLAALMAERDPCDAVRSRAAELLASA